MNKAELVKHLAESADVTKAQAESVLNALVFTIQDSNDHGEEVVIPGIGRFSVIQRAARKGRNPATGEAIDIPAKRVPKFTPSQALKAVSIKQLTR